jgi:hypothetical protein
MATVATRRENKPCFTKREQNRLDSDRPSHGRRLRSSSLGASGFERTRDVTPPARGLLPLRRVQFWEIQNRWRLDRSHRGGTRHDFACLVDASDVRTVNAAQETLRRAQ